jgi:excisionase family DNA binding protein
MAAMSKNEERPSMVLTVPEAGQKLGLSRGSAYAAAARGDIPTIRIGRLLRVPKAALDRLLDNTNTAEPQGSRDCHDPTSPCARRRHQRHARRNRNLSGERLAASG